MTKTISGPEIYSYIYSLAETQTCINYINLLLVNYDLINKYEELLKNETNGDKIMKGLYCINNFIELDCDEIPIKNNIPQPPIEINKITENDILVKFIHR